jgi:hypothetical protein
MNHNPYYPAALFVSGQFLFNLEHGHDADSLSVVNHEKLLVATRAEIADRVSNLLTMPSREARDKVIALACGACAMREGAPLARDWIAATAGLRTPALHRDYSTAQTFVSPRFHVVRRLAATLAGEKIISRAVIKFITGKPRAAA